MIAPLLVEFGERWPEIPVGSYASFSAAGPRVELVAKSVDTEALAEATAWLDDAVQRSNRADDGT